MYDNLLTIFEKPSLYKKMEIPFWDDEHISLQMLKAHLNPEFNGASRKLDFINKSADWITRIVRPSEFNELLDIGCGPGIYAERFAQFGYSVTGIDFSKRSINYATSSAAKQNLNIQYLYQDYLNMNLNKTFDFSTLIYCDYGALSSEDRKTLLKVVYTHLRPGGKFLLDVFSMSKYNCFEEKNTWNIYPTGGFWKKEKYLEFNSSFRYSDCVTLEQTTIISPNDPAAIYYIWNTYFTKETLINEMKSEGFKICEVFSDVAGKPYCEDSLTIAVLLEK